MANFSSSRHFRHVADRRPSSAALYPLLRQALLLLSEPETGTGGSPLRNKPAAMLPNRSQSGYLSRRNGFVAHRAVPMHVMTSFTFSGQSKQS